MVHISKTRGAFHPNPGFGSDVFVARVKLKKVTPKSVDITHPMAQVRLTIDL